MVFVTTFFALDTCKHDQVAEMGNGKDELAGEPPDPTTMPEASPSRDDTPQHIFTFEGPHVIDNHHISSSSSSNSQNDMEDRNDDDDSVDLLKVEENTVQDHLLPDRDNSPANQDHSVLEQEDSAAKDDDSTKSKKPASKTAAKPVSKEKKKGTAKAVKAPRRAKPIGRARKKGGTKRGAASRKKSSSKLADDGAEGAEGAGGDDSESESDHGPYCICRGPDDHRWMIGCDRCEDWFHGECIGMDSYTGDNLVQRYICPKCTDGDRYVTRYKKLCSLAGCNKPARIYNAKHANNFCSDDHRQTWWEQLVATLPAAASDDDDNTLTQEAFVSLLSPKKGSKGGIMKKPLGISSDFWETVDLDEVLTPEERVFLDCSASDRYNLGEEIVLCKKMLQLLEMALQRREAAMEAGREAGRGSGKDLCGYDTRLDTVGVTHQFNTFIQTPAGEVIFRTGRLEAPDPSSQPAQQAPHSPQLPRKTSVSGGESVPAADHNKTDKEADPLTAGMCMKKKCKPHLGWSAILNKTVNRQIKELAAQAKDLLDAEARVRESAATRFMRKTHEHNTVIVFESSEESDQDMSDQDMSDQDMSDQDMYQDMSDEVVDGYMSDEVVNRYMLDEAVYGYMSGVELPDWEITDTEPGLGDDCSMVDSVR
ncbi:hypothetical protein QBC46DRAFT_148672 [Diplogelasinospora grovesii]|uniref:PHD-type domain-containing protein n=1 Tax=Diplogelasinospora grovesii TaxID=303347 RepID=A0AAN6N8S2_9PEZI|nr:hypothetical protein QBC46DRAFT_148672 [Diplogelasinospora grovesii]